MNSLFDLGKVSERLAAVLVMVMAAAWTAQSQAADPYQYNIIGTTNTAPGECPSVTFSVTNTATGQLTDLRHDPAWTTAGAGLRLHFGWDTRDFNNTGSNTNLPNPLSPTGAPFARGAAYPIPVNALATGVVNNGYCTGVGVIDHGDGTYTATAPLPIPSTATGSGRVIMEGHSALKDANGEFIPIKSAYQEYPITDKSVVERRPTVDIDKCMVCHRTDGTGFNGTGEPGRLTLHGRNRTEKLICPVCHNPSQTDVQRRIASDKDNYPVRIGGYTYAEQSVDFKRLVHGIKATSVGFRKYPLVVLGPILPQPYPPAEVPFMVDADEPGFGRYVFDARKVSPFPAKLKNCVNCHFDDGKRGTFELPLDPNVRGSTLNTQSAPAVGPLTRATVNAGVIDPGPTNDVKITPTASVCSACHDKNDVISHMVNTGGASFSALQTDIGYKDISSGKIVTERCVDCHGPGKDKSVRKVHGISSSTTSD